MEETKDTSLETLTQEEEEGVQLRKEEEGAGGNMKKRKWKREASFSSTRSDVSIATILPDIPRKNQFALV